MKTKKKNTTPLIQSLDRGLTIIETIAASKRPVSLKELAGLLNIDYSSVYRLANTLKIRGLLMHTDNSKDYILGPAIWRYARNYNWGSLLVKIAHEDLLQLTTLTGETSHLAILEGDHALFVDHATTHHVIVVSGQTGECVPLYCTAHGKALLADMDKAALEALLGSGPFEAKTDRTVTDLAQLAKDCHTIRDRGCAFDDGELLEGIRCVAAPIRDSDGSIMASIGISAPIDRFPESRYAECGEQVRQAALNISRKIVPQDGGE